VSPGTLPKEPGGSADDSRPSPAGKPEVAEVASRLPRKVVTGISQTEIDAGAKILRERMQSSKRLNDWETLPNSTKKKWRDHSRAVLEAATIVVT